MSSLMNGCWYFLLLLKVSFFSDFVFEARNTETANVIYLVSPAVRSLLILPSPSLPSSSSSSSSSQVLYSPLHVVNAGVRIFEKERFCVFIFVMISFLLDERRRTTFGVVGDCDYRLCQEGVSFLSKIMRKRMFVHFCCLFTDLFIFVFFIV
jgi:hypothetical protein